MFMPTPLDPTPVPGKAYFSIAVVITHPFSRGSCHIASSDPLAPPIIDAALLDNDLDMEILVSGHRLARKLCESEPLCSLTVDQGPGPQSDEEMKAYIRETVRVSYHPIGTASMLPREEGGVVDSNLKVYGTRNIRVVRRGSYFVVIALLIYAALGGCLHISHSNRGSPASDYLCHG